MNKKKKLILITGALGQDGIILSKKYFLQLIIVINYFLRRKKIPTTKIPENCRKKILDAGLYF